MVKQIRVKPNSWKKNFSKPLSKKQKSQVKSIVNKNLEKKYYIAANGTTAVSPGPTLNPIDLLAPTQGTSDNDQRIGDAIKLKSAEIRMSLRTSKTDEFIRVIVFQYKGDSSLAAPVLTDLLQSTSAVNDAAFISSYTNDKKRAGRFHVLHDRVHFMGTNGDDGCPRNVAVSKRLNLKFASKDVSFMNGGVEGQNKIYMYVLTDAVTTPLLLNYYAKIRYTDA